MNKRYQKVMALYALSTLIPALLHRKSEKGACEWLTKTAVGYGIFAAGLKQMTKAKQRNNKA